MASANRQGIAKVHTHVSNRAKSKQALEKKPTFRPCLSNPFEIDWSVPSISLVEIAVTFSLASRPSVPINVQNAVLSRLVLSLESVAAYHTSKTAQSREKKRRRSQLTGPNKRRKSSPGNQHGTSDPISLPAGTSSAPGELMGVDSGDQESVVLTEPPIIPHLILGINQVTKRLEHQARAYRQTLSATDTITNDDTSQLPHGPISIVFACRADVDPPLLISHLPTLIASCNSSRNALANPESHPPIRLVPIPKGSESLLADATGVRRVAVLALDVIVLSLLLRFNNSPDLYLESPERYSRLGSISIPIGFSSNSPGILAVSTGPHGRLSPWWIRSFVGSHTYKTATYDDAKGYEGFQRTKNKGPSGGKTEEKGA